MPDAQTSQQAHVTRTSFGPGTQQGSTSCEVCLENHFRFALILPPALHHKGNYRGASKRADGA